MTQIDTTKVSSITGIRIGQKESPNTLIEFVNLRCPYCRQWWEEKFNLISSEVAKGNLHYVIKLFNKESPGLYLGNVMHQYVPNNEEAIEIISKIYDTQNEWGNLFSTEEVMDYAENTLHLVKQNNDAMLESIVDEALQANIRFVPTLIVDDFDFDQKISNDAFLSLFNK